MLQALETFMKSEHNKARFLEIPPTVIQTPEIRECEEKLDRLLQPNRKRSALCGISSEPFGLL